MVDVIVEINISSVWDADIRHILVRKGEKGKYNEIALLVDIITQHIMCTSKLRHL